MDTLPSELTELNVLTLNCWGLLHISKLRAARLTAIGRAIASAPPATTPHVVALQECWTQKDYASIRRETRAILPYGKFYYSGAFGGGLAILSRWPIEESSMFQYPLSGRPTAFWRGDWYVGKGVACAKIRYGKGPRQVLEVFNTHTHAIYEHPPLTDSYQVHHLAQAWELSKLVRGAAARGHLVLAMGDFNQLPFSLPYRIFTAHSPVSDVWRVLHPESSIGAAEDCAERARRKPVPTAQFNIEENGVTSNSVYNTWSWPKWQQKALGPGRDPQLVSSDTLDPRGKRIDFIFASSGAAEGEQATQGWVVKDARVGMLQRHADLQCSLSDHFSVEATLILRRTDSVPPPVQRTASHLNSPAPPAPTPGPGATHTDSASARSQPQAPSRLGRTLTSDVMNGAFLDVQTPAPSSYSLSMRGSGPPHAPDGLSYDEQLEAARAPVPRLPPSTYDEVLALTQRYVERERFQRRWRGVHFATWVAVSLVCYVGVWFSPPYVGFVLMLLSSLGLVAGAVDGLLALLFFGSELRALAEFEWEIENARASACGLGGAGQLQASSRSRSGGGGVGGNAGEQNLAGAAGLRITVEGGGDHTTDATRRGRKMS